MCGFRMSDARRAERRSDGRGFKKIFFGEEPELIQRSGYK